MVFVFSEKKGPINKEIQNEMPGSLASTFDQLRYGGSSAPGGRYAATSGGLSSERSVHRFFLRIPTKKTENHE